MMPFLSTNDQAGYSALILFYDSGTLIHIIPHELLKVYKHLHDLMDVLMQEQYIN